jgi:hypothetical protein
MTHRYSHSQQLITAATQVRISIVKFNDSSAKSLEQEIYKRFTPDGSQNWNLWDRPNRSTCKSLYAPEGWKWISDFIGENKCILFLNDGGIFEFSNGQNLVKVIGETAIPEFNITNPAMDYVIVMNHHDYLIAFGTATAWLEKYM